VVCLFPDVPVNCRPVQQDECQQRGYTATVFPNSIGHNGPRTANHDWNKMIYIDKAVSCSEHLIEFSCAIVYPNCTVSDVEALKVVGPCRSLCQGYLSSVIIYIFDVFFSTRQHAPRLYTMSSVVTGVELSRDTH